MTPAAKVRVIEVALKTYDVSLEHVEGVTVERKLEIAEIAIQTIKTGLSTPSD